MNIGNRILAIKKAILNANPREIVLIAGKGHEEQQIYKNKILNISDKKIVTYSESVANEYGPKIDELGELNVKFQFITLAGFHTQNIAIFELAEKYKKEGMSAYSRIQQQEFAREKDGYTSVKHQREVGTSYFDAVSNTISSGKSSTTAMDGSTESEQF